MNGNTVGFFGENKILKWKNLIEATDRLVPNMHLSDDREHLLSSFNNYITIPKYITMTFNPLEKDLLLSVFEPLEIKYSSALVKDGLTVALKTMKDGYPQYFLIEWVFSHLKQKDLSVLRFQGKEDSPEGFTIELDTRDREFNPASFELTLETKTFHYEYKGINGIESDIITSTDGLVGNMKEGYNYIVKGTTSRWEFLIDHLRNNFSRGKVPYNLQTIIECYYNKNDIIAGIRVHEEMGMEIFLTKEGYEYLKEQNFSILRGKKKVDTKDWEKLELLFHSQVMA